MPISAQGLAVTSRICPRTAPSFCAATRGISTASNSATLQTLNTHERAYFLMRDSPLRLHTARSWRALLSWIRRWIQRSGMGCRTTLNNAIDGVGFRESTRTQQAAVAYSAGDILALVARPGKMQRGAELDALANNFAFLQGDHWRCNFNMRFRAGAHAD